ncbi:MAG TPA: PAS domain-containing protein, partial [Bacillota bacterium]|nr:PAS domain-containing protein [Bacillota bacterium]
MKKNWKGSKKKLSFYRPFLTVRPNVRFFFQLFKTKLHILQKKPPFIWFNTGRELNQLAVSLDVGAYPTLSSPDLIKIAAHLKYLNQSLANCQESVNRILATDVFPLILITPDENRIESLNGAFLELIGYTKDEITGRTLGELEVWVNSEQCSRFILAIRDKKPVFNWELQFFHRNRRLLTEIVNAVPLTLYDTEYLIISFKDITEQKLILTQLQESYTNVTEILDGISDVFVALNSNWTFTYINNPGPFFLNRKRETLLGKNLWDTFPTLVGTIAHQELLQAMRDKKPAHFEAPSILGDEWYQIDTYPLKDGISFFGRNITSQKRAMEALQRSNQQIIAIMDNIPEVFFLLDNNWRFIYLNKQAERHFERSREELIGKRIWAQIPKLAGSQMATQFHKANSEHIPVYYEGLSPLSGQYFEFHLSPTSDGLTVSMLNINERKLKEEARAKAEERFSHILDNIGNPVLVLDQNWHIIYINQEMGHYLQKTPIEYLDKYMWDIQPDFTASALFQRLNTVLMEQQSARFEEFFSVANCWMEFYVFRSASDLVICLKDLSERKKYETELSGFQLRINTILESINDAFFTLDRQWRFTSLNKMAESLWQKERGQLIGKEIWNEFPQLVRTVIEREFHRAVKEKRGEHFEAFVPGINIWLEIDAHPDENGLNVYCRDISLRKRLESSSATERELLLITLRSIGDGVIAANRAGQVILLNQTAEELTGWTYDEAIGQPLNKVFYVINDKTSEPYDNIVALTIETGETTELPNAVLVNRNFKEIMLSNSCAPIRSGEGEVLGVVMVFQDITEKLKTEAELLKAHKIESLGVLAGGIAHDFNNYLAAILANIQLSVLRLEKGHDIKKSLNEAIEATKKASELTKQLLTFAKGGAPVKKSVSIANLLEETTNFHLSGSKVKPIFCIPEDLWQV